MSTTPHATPVTPARQELKIVSHSNLFYWWPVWVVGYLMAVITLIHGTLLAVVPEKTVAVKDIAAGSEGKVRAEVVGQATTSHTDVNNRSALLFPENFNWKEDEKKLLKEPKIHMSSSKGPGIIFFTVVLLVIFITNVSLRGLWSVLVIVLVILAATLLSVFRVWDDVFDLLGLLDIRVSMGGFIAVSTALLVLWLVAFFFFDPRMYMIFSAGQIRYCLEVGDAEHVHDTTNMSVRKQRDDVFRHWILGLGSGDLIVTTGGAKPETFDLPNVLFIGGKLKQIEELLRSRPVVAGR
jgi:hypothetical protein